MDGDFPKDKNSNHLLSSSTSFSPPRVLLSFSLCDLQRTFLPPLQCVRYSIPSDVERSQMHHGEFDISKSVCRGTFSSIRSFPTRVRNHLFPQQGRTRNFLFFKTLTSNMQLNWIRSLTSGIVGRWLLTIKTENINLPRRQVIQRLKTRHVLPILWSNIKPWEVKPMVCIGFSTVGSN